MELFNSYIRHWVICKECLTGFWWTGDLSREEIPRYCDSCNKEIMYIGLAH